MLIPARTDTSYWFDYCFKGNVLFIKGRIRFVDPDTNKKGNPAFFPSALVVFGNIDDLQKQKLNHLGVWR